MRFRKPKPLTNVVVVSVFLALLTTFISILAGSSASFALIIAFMVYYLNIIAVGVWRI